jgi:hypothetical protein
MAWPFRRRRRGGRHRLESPRVGVVLPGVSLAPYPVAEVLEPGAPAAPATAAQAAVPPPRVADDPAIMPLPARIVLGFADGSTQLVTPMSTEAERMQAAADRLLGPERSSGGSRLVR